MALISTDEDMMPLPGGEAPQPVREELDPWAGHEDYFGDADAKRWYFPDGKQYIEFLPMNEGKRAKYESGTSRDVRFNRRTDDAAIRMDAAADRRALVMQSVTGWYMTRRVQGGLEAVPFSIGSPGANFDRWYEKADPKLINKLVDAIRKENPWMTDDMTVEMIDEEIQRLQEMREQVVAREAREKNS